MGFGKSVIGSNCNSFLKTKILKLMNLEIDNVRVYKA
jgi:hypothetical protein